MNVDVSEVTGRGLDALAGILDAIGEPQAAEHVDGMRDEIVDIVSAVEHSDPYAITDSIVAAARAGLREAGLGLPAGLLGFAWPLLAKVLEPFYTVSLSGTSVDGVADLT